MCCCRADVDDQAYEIALSEKWRTRMEEAGHVELDLTQANNLAHTKRNHIVLLTLAMPLAVTLYGSVGGPFWGTATVLLAFLIGAVVTTQQSAVACVWA